MMLNIEERTTCRICEGELEVVLDLGRIYPSNFVNGETELHKAPLRLAQCKSCQLVQLKDTVELDSMYRQYWYRSSLNPSMVRDLKDVVENIENIVELNNDDIVVDIGANDGTMLSLYKNKNIIKIGIDPARNLQEKALENCDYFFNDYFSAEMLKDFPKAKVITSIAMFYDLEDPHTFVEDIKNSLAQDGVWVVQFTDLVSMMRANAFDNICHEHLEYYTLIDLVILFSKHGLSIFDVTYNKVNGGSLRVFVAHKNYRELDYRFIQALREEVDYLSTDSIEEFSKRVEDIKNTTRDYIENLNHNDYSVALMGASTKGNTLLQYFGLDNKLIDHAAEVNEDKFGLKTVGTNIPIISQKDSLALKPDYYFIPIWHFASFLIEKHKDYLKNGGKFIIPMPEFLIVKMNEKGEVEWQGLTKSLSVS